MAVTYIDMSAVSEEDMQTFRRRVVGRSIGEDTFEAYQLWIRRFEDWYDGDDPTLRDLEDFDTLLEDPSQPVYPWANNVGRPAPSSYSYSSRNQAMSALKMWIRRQYDREIPEQPGDIVIGEEEEFDPTYLSRERVREIIEQAPSACNCDGCQAALSLSYDAVMRASELVRCRVSDVDLENGDVYVRASKGSRDSTVTISDHTVSLIEEWLAISDHSTGKLFTNTYGSPWTKGSWATHVIEYHCEEGSHAFGRHTPILHMLQSGMSFGDVYRRARHKSPATTARYARYVDVDVPSWAGD